jgi:hypothetical protein
MSVVKVNPYASGIYNIKLESSVKVTGSILPNGRNLCTKEAKMNGYKMPRYGVVLFGISHIKVDDIVYKIDPHKGIPDFRSLYESQYGKLNYHISEMRLIFEMSVQYKQPEQEKSYSLASSAWDCMLPYLKAESEWVRELMDNKTYELALAYMPRPLRNKHGHRCRGFRFNTKNRINDTPVSVVFKQYARNIRESKEVSSSIESLNSICPSVALAMLTGETLG